MVQPSEVMAVEWLMLSLAWILVGLRAAVRLQANHAHHAAVIVSDLFLVLGAFSILGLVVCDTLTYRMGAMTDFSMYSVELGKIRFATNYLFDVGLYLPKLSILAIYYQLVPTHQKALRAALHLLTAVTITAVLVTTFTDTFWCGRDPSINWAIGEGLCSTFTSTTLMVSNWSMCITIEALLFLLPVPLLRQVRSLAGGQKIGLIVVFSLGIVTMMVSAGRFISMMYTGNYISVYVWATTEFAVSIMVVACMALRPLAARTWRATTNKITHHLSGNNSKKGNGGSNPGTRTGRSSPCATPRVRWHLQGGVGKSCATLLVLCQIERRCRATGATGTTRSPRFRTACLGSGTTGGRVVQVWQMLCKKGAIMMDILRGGYFFFFFSISWRIWAAISDVVLREPMSG
ncbi:hypothetical protein MAPG_11440 [Magnaporthiopsis poae ATCC 64411]|uniref:Rhodopsin domain-containing protein n=1 Tax=Magnaporthiopsis poae (strain ATCC 64411 / 73-15) TaxID=644358 RepID=A0A0C4EFA1_MAGP6|nr:hypothetical protein MAPG_11440 [Magnaporthiopsis poae ATCC 64411]